MVGQSSPICSRTSATRVRASRDLTPSFPKIDRCENRQCRSRLSLGAGALLGLAAWLAPAVAGADPLRGSSSFHRGATNVVFAQTESTTGNQVVAYDQAPNGRLALARTYDTGGLGAEVGGGGSDHLASQGSLAYDAVTGDLYAVNAGSNTVSVFSARGDRLSLRQVIGSGGDFPVSVAVHNDFVYVLNAMDGGGVQGYFSLFGHLIPSQARTGPSDSRSRARRHQQSSSSLRRKLRSRPMALSCW